LQNFSQESKTVIPSLIIAILTTHTWPTLHQCECCNKSSNSVGLLDYEAENLHTLHSFISFVTYHKGQLALDLAFLVWVSQTIYVWN